MGQSKTGAKRLFLIICLILSIALVWHIDDGLCQNNFSAEREAHALCNLIEAYNSILRPRSFSEYMGAKRLISNVNIQGLYQANKFLDAKFSLASMLHKRGQERIDCSAQTTLILGGIIKCCGISGADIFNAGASGPVYATFLMIQDTVKEVNLWNSIKCD